MRVQTQLRRWINKGDKNLQHTFLLGRPEAPRYKILQHVKNHLQGQILVPFAYSFHLLPEDSAGRIIRALWWMNREFSSVIIPP
jgi:hypothetical protein